VALALASIFAVTALFHAAAIVSPSLAPGAPGWRHGLFVALNAAVAIGLLWRPPGFVAAFGVLTGQQVYSHGRDILDAWRTEARVDWMSVGVLVVMVGTLIALAKRRV
jgi:hypothetical protein